MSKISIIGIDLAKQVFQLHGNDSRGHKILGKQLKRDQLLPFLATQPICLVAMEACGGAHYWARQIKALGHEVKIIHPRYVKPFVQVHKNDQRDAQAIAEAAARPSMPSVAVKSVEQLDIQALHRVRERLVKEKTAIGNELRGLLLEMGITIAQGHKSLRETVPLILEDAERALSVRARHLIHDLREQWLERERRIADYDRELKLIAKENAVCEAIQSLPGIGLVNSTLLYSHAGDAAHFKSARQFGAYLGLTPRQHATGGVGKMLGISKQGSKHVRKQLVHDARAAYRVLVQPDNDSRLGRWVKRKSMEGKHVNKIVVALANKLARIVWAIMKTGQPYQPMRGLEA
ncbi:IS110 family transposase [Pseudomonas sp. gcc21]|uniref:IS110 family transposase n=1 Tax=Pseudomonas sp. gcc21 TaxID=2726989 RepID=UPI0014519C7E|nr:IS110 family transposase [Pseudomonas sp. gcc21]QJD57513.1 IS110 family transposase [Pseudomonas sp. gcc21]